jgi:peptide/nickel transport system substrate-binding protein
MKANRAWLLCVLGTVAFAGCSVDKQKPRPSGKAREASKPIQQRPPRSGGHIVLPSNEPRDLNPALMTRFDRVMPLIFEGLVGLDVNLKLVPRLASSWTVSPDGKSVTFTLRKGVTWHDGKPFTAADVVFTYRVIRETQRPTVWRAHMTGIDTVEAPDPLTVVVTYRQPYGPALSSWTVGLIPEHAHGGNIDRAAAQDQRGPGIGTGPFRLSRWEPGRRIVLERYDGYWAGKPYLGSVELLLNVPSSDQLQLLKAGKLDFAEITDIDQWSQEVHRPEFRKRFEVQNEVESRFRMIAWNGLRPGFEDPRVRVALAQTLDRSRVIEDVHVGLAQPLSGPFFPTMYGADPAIAAYPFDLSAAATMLDEAGHRQNDAGERFEIELIARDAQRTSTQDQMLAIFRRDLQSVGVKLRVTYLETTEFFGRLVLREFDAALLEWLPSVPDPDPYELLHSSQINGGPNYAGYANPRVDSLLDQARALSERSARKALYHKVHRLVHQEEPYTLLYAPYGHYAWSRRVHGVNPRDVGTQPRFPGLARWWVEPPSESL